MSEECGYTFRLFVIANIKHFRKSDGVSGENTGVTLYVMTSKVGEDMTMGTASNRNIQPHP
jgi:hypothetical protein